jgi:hypothetical protein
MNKKWMETKARGREERKKTGKTNEKISVRSENSNDRKE